MLPLVPPETLAWSPYSGLDALCGNVLLISLDNLVEDGLLSKADLPSKVAVADCDFPKVTHDLDSALMSCKVLCVCQRSRSSCNEAPPQQLLLQELHHPGILLYDISAWVVWGSPGCPVDPVSVFNPLLCRWMPSRRLFL